MPWELVVLTVGMVSTAALGWVTFRYSQRNDAQAAEAKRESAEALNMAANIQSTYDILNGITDGLRSDVTRLRAAHAQCEEATNSLRRSLAESYLERDKLAREVARQKATTDEHEVTIARHELTINQLRAGTQADRRE